MRILIISHGHPDYSIGGAEVASYTLFQSLREQGHQAFYLSRLPAQVRRHTSTPLMSLRRGESEFFIDTAGWDEFWLSNTRLTDFVPAFSSLLKKLQPDVVHFHHLIGYGVESIALVKRLLPNARIVITLHEYLAICANHGQMVTPKLKLCRESMPALCSSCFPDRSSTDFAIREASIRSHLVLADAYVSPSQFLIDRFVRWGLTRERFSLIENGLPKREQSKHSGLPSRRRNRLAFFGQLSEFKGLPVLLEAISRISEEVWGGAGLSIFGGNLEYQPQDFRSRFDALLLGLDRRVRFCGSYRQEEVGELMHDVDWVIVPSIWWENSPVVIQEAFQVNRPVIVSNIGGMAEKIIDGVNGLHFRVGNPESLAETIGRALTESDLWSKLSNSAPAITSSEAFAARHVVLYRPTKPSLQDALKHVA